MEETGRKKPPRRKQRNPRAMRAQREKKAKSGSPRENKRNRELFGMLRIAVVLLVCAAALIALVFSLRPSVQYLNAAEIQRISRLGVLKVGILTDAPGFASNEQGLEVELARALGKRIFPDLDPDAAVELVPVNANTAVPKVRNETVDISIAMQWAATPDGYAYSIPYFADAVRLLCLPGRENTPLAAGQTVGIISGSGVRRVWEQFNTEAELGLQATEYVAYQDMCIALSNGNVHYIALSASHVRLLEGWGFVQHRQSLGALEYVGVTGLDKPALASLLDLVIQDMQKDGSLEALVQQYGLSGYRAW